MQLSGLMFIITVWKVKGHVFNWSVSSLRFSARMRQWACSECWSLPWRYSTAARRAAVRTTAPPTASPKTTVTQLASAARCCRGCRSEGCPPCSPSTSCASWWVVIARAQYDTHSHTLMSARRRPECFIRPTRPLEIYQWLDAAADWTLQLIGRCSWLDAAAGQTDVDWHHNITVFNPKSRLQSFRLNLFSDSPPR